MRGPPAGRVPRRLPAGAGLHHGASLARARPAPGAPRRDGGQRLGHATLPGGAGRTASRAVEVVPNTQFLVDRHAAGPTYRPTAAIDGAVLPAPAPRPGHPGRRARGARRRALELRRAEPPRLPGRGAAGAPGLRPGCLTRAVMREVEREGHGVGAPPASSCGHPNAGARRARRLPRAAPRALRPYEDAMRSDGGVLYHSRSRRTSPRAARPEETARAARLSTGRAGADRLGGRLRAPGHRLARVHVVAVLAAHARVARRQCLERAAAAAAVLPQRRHEMRCLRQALGRTLATGYTHHIERLMLLANFCLLAGVRPAPSPTGSWPHTWTPTTGSCSRTSWAWGSTPTAGWWRPSLRRVAAYIDRMSDYCGECRYDRGRRTGPEACPFNTLYWNFLLTHERRCARILAWGPPCSACGDSARPSGAPSALGAGAPRPARPRLSGTGARAPGPPRQADHRR